MEDSIKDKYEHEERVRCALEGLPDEDDIAELAARFKAISEPSRLKILLALSYGELCVEHLTQAVGGNQSAVSHQLKTLKDHRIIKCRRQGKQVIYSIADGHVLTMISVAKEHLNCNE
ncbi:MAG: metalloregulator ArsR/SmtB family transcription factor [Clostridia bacterium]|nr:metalloregulator ArsR/SmtB family transcription factor [Clostridia bacterium]